MTQGRATLAALPDTLIAQIEDANRRGDFAAIHHLIDPLLAQSPDAVDYLMIRANALQREQRFAEATAIYEDILHRGLADDATLYRDLARALCGAGQFAEAIARSEEALKRDAYDPDTWYVTGRCQLYLGRHAEAMRCYRQAIAADPQHVHARYQMGQLKLMLTDCREGHDEYALRFQLTPYPWRPYPFPLWQGEALQGKKLLLWAEQGPGDIYMLAGLIPYLLAQQPAQVTLMMYEHMAALFRRSTCARCGCGRISPLTRRTHSISIARWGS